MKSLLELLTPLTCKHRLEYMQAEQGLWRCQALWWPSSPLSRRAIFCEYVHICKTSRKIRAATSLKIFLTWSSWPWTVYVHQCVIKHKNTFDLVSLFSCTLTECLTPIDLRIQFWSIWLGSSVPIQWKMALWISCLKLSEPVDTWFKTNVNQRKKNVWCSFVLHSRFFDEFEVFVCERKPQWSSNAAPDRFNNVSNVGEIDTWPDWW